MTARFKVFLLLYKVQVLCTYKKFILEQIIVIVSLTENAVTAATAKATATATATAVTLSTLTAEFY